MAKKATTAAPAASTPYRLMQVDQSLMLFEEQIAQAIFAGDEVPESVLAVFGAYTEESSRNVDNAAAWLDMVEAHIKHLKEQEKLNATARRRAEAAVSALKVYLRAKIDGVAQLAIDSGSATAETADHTIQGLTRKFWTQLAGGKESLVVTDETLIPENYFFRELVVRIPAGEIGNAQLSELFKIMDGAELAYECDPDNLKRDDAAIRALLEQDKNAVPGATLKRGRVLQWSKPKSTPNTTTEQLTEGEAA